MSYILDALRKSEAERNRESAPSLATITASPPRSRVGITVALVGVLLVNTVLLFLWLSGWTPGLSQTDTAASSAPAEPAAKAVAAPQPPPTTTQSPPQPPTPEVASRPLDAPPTQAAEATLPSLDISTHVYSDDPSLSAVTINGRRRVVGDLIAPDIRLVEVTETGVVVDHRGRRVVVDVLQDWR